MKRSHRRTPSFRNPKQDTAVSYNNMNSTIERLNAHKSSTPSNLNPDVTNHHHSKQKNTYSYPHPGPLRMDLGKQKVWGYFVNLVEGCGKTRTEINDTTPHTRYICETSWCRTHPFTMGYTKNECYPSILLFWKLPHFPQRTCENTSNMYVSIA